MVAINYELNVIFFHIPKTAGSYIQQKLGRHYNFFNFNDLARFDNIYENIHNFYDTSMGVINNSHIDIFTTNPWSDKSLGINKYFCTSKKLIKMMSLNKEIWDKMFKFTFVRCPYSRFISSWNFIIKGFKSDKSIIKSIFLDNNITLQENINKMKEIEYFIENRHQLTDIAYNHVFITQYQHILNEDNVNNMDFIGKLENLEEDLKTVLNKIGISEICHNKGEKVNKSDHEPYKTYYNQNIFNFVNSYFDEDFKHFNYVKYNTFEEFMQE